MELITRLQRVEERTYKWGKQSGHVEIDYEDAKALIACAKELKKRDPNHIALKWLAADCLAD